MNLQYKRLTEQYLDEFIEMRIAQLREEGATEQIDIKPNLLDYYHRHMSDGTFVSWLAFRYIYESRLQKKRNFHGIVKQSGK